MAIKFTQEEEAVTWDSSTQSFKIVLIGDGPPGYDARIVAHYQPPFMYYTRIRESGNANEWGPEFGSPLTICIFDGLKPDVLYDVEIRAEEDGVRGESRSFQIKANENGQVTQIGDAEGVDFRVRRSSS